MLAPQHRRRWALTALLTVVALGASAVAQPQLTVNGLDVRGATNALVSGTAYAPAAALAHALGARFEVDLATQRLTFMLGARVVQLRSVSDPAAAATVAGAITRDGLVVAGPAAVVAGAEAFVPVKATAEALGAAVSFVPANNQVLVVVPRPVVGASVEGRGADERLVVRSSAPARVTSFVNEAVETLELRIDRGRLSAPQTFVGDAFVRADVVAGRGDVDVRIQLAPGVRAQWLEVPDGAGFAVVVTFHRDAPPAGPAPASERSLRVVLDPAGSGALGDVTLEAARVAAQRLDRAGFETMLTRYGPAAVSVTERSAAGTGARVFVSLQPGDVAQGSVRIYHLGDAADLGALEDAVRVNAEELVRRPTTDAVRRQVLLDLVVDLSAGERVAADLAAALRDGGGFQVAAPIAAPVAVLTGAAGRGVLVEANAVDLADPRFASLLADAVAAAAGRPTPP